ncbi:hypothetical protein B0H16DRAFT_1521657 [Mycena metata]|uniref:Uncharacterized protein n=1 Tax=Mycena metata TaxID=1033252 RepID=A0AAD7JPF0_9AGAR|nr:hypothetical protein B0H16DRAFT_1521657 [Mycena metata]
MGYPLYQLSRKVDATFAHVGELSEDDEDFFDDGTGESDMKQDSEAKESPFGHDDAHQEDQFCRHTNLPRLHVLTTKYQAIQIWRSLTITMRKLKLVPDCNMRRAMVARYLPCNQLNLHPTVRIWQQIRSLKFPTIVERAVASFIGSSGGYSKG